MKVDLLLVSVDATFGLRRAADELEAGLATLGVSTARVRTARAPVTRLRGSLLVEDLAHATAVRRRVDLAERALRPRALIYPSPLAALLEPARRLARGAVRVDAVARQNRPGRRNAPQRALEPRVLGEAALLLPYGLRRPAVALGDRVLPLPAVAEPSAGALDGARERNVLVYAGNPHKKGLDRAAAAFGRARTAGWRLVVCGLEAGRGREFLRDRDVPEPPGTWWPGTLAPGAFRSLCRRSAVYLSASRFEDFGMAQLEALADGALLACAPSPGNGDFLALAEELTPRLVAASGDPDDLARALDTALALAPEAAARYRARAAELLAPYAASEAARRLEEVVARLLQPEIPASPLAERRPCPA